MKLIIDISEEAKKHIDTFKGKFLCGDGFDLIEAIQNGTPLEDIIAEIADIPAFDYDTHKVRTRALEILDNIGSEVKPSETNS